VRGGGNFVLWKCEAPIVILHRPHSNLVLSCHYSVHHVNIKKMLHLCIYVLSTDIKKNKQVFPWTLTNSYCYCYTVHFVELLNCYTNYWTYIYFFILYDGVCVLFITGLIVSLSLCVCMYILSFGAIGFMFVRYLYVCLSTSKLHLWIACWICLCYLSVGSLFYFFYIVVLHKIINLLYWVFLSIITIVCYC